MTKRLHSPPAVAVLLALALALPFASSPAHADPQTLKIATLAPEGSGWMKLFHEWAQNVEKRSAALPNGLIKTKFYAGGVAGDERDAVRKMRAGQINGAAVTAVGLGLIQPEVRILELPFLFNNYEELDYVRDTLDKEFRQKFEEKGYILLGWGDVGPVRLFTNIPIRSKADLTRSKFWAWTDDPVVRTLFSKVGLDGVPLGVPDVLPALQTGRIDAAYGSPLSTVALSWHTKVKYITSMVLSQSVGATVITKKQWEAMSKEQQEIVMEESKKLTAAVLKYVRSDNEASLKKMLSMGLQVVETPPDLIKEFQVQGKAVCASLDGTLYTKDFRERVEKLIATKRSGGK